VKIPCILASAKKEKITDLCANSVILNGPLYSQFLLKKNFCAQNIKYFSVKIGRMIVRFVIYTEVFFLQIFDTFQKIQKGAPRCLRSKAIFPTIIPLPSPLPLILFVLA
jgi:hypothetical protein